MRFVPVTTLALAALHGLALSISHAEEVRFTEPIEDTPEGLPIHVQFPAASVLMLLDTCCQGNAIEENLRPPSAVTREKVNVHGYGRQLEREIFESPSLTLGEWKVPSSAAVALDFAGIRSVLGVDVHGFLGAPCLQKVAVDVNYDQRSLRIIEDYQPPASLVPVTEPGKTPGYRALPFKLMLQDSDPAIEITLDDVPIDMRLDTGSNDFIDLDHETFGKLVASGAIKVRETTNSTEVAAGDIKMRQGVFTRGTLLGVPLKGQEVNDSIEANLVGLSFLRHFNFVVDFAGQHFYFTPRQHVPFIPARALGIIIRFQDGHGYVDTTDAPKKGTRTRAFRVGDLVLQVGPLHDREMTRAALEVMLAAHLGETIDVVTVHPGSMKLARARIHLPATDKDLERVK